MNLTEQRLREELDAFAGVIGNGFDTARLNHRIRRQTQVRRAGAALAVVAVLAAVPVAIGSLGSVRDRQVPQVAGQPTSEPTDSGPPSSQPPAEPLAGYRTVQEQTISNPAGFDGQEVSVTLTLTSPDDLLLITVGDEVPDGTSLNIAGYLADSSSNDVGSIHPFATAHSKHWHADNPPVVWNYPATETLDPSGDQVVFDWGDAGLEPGDVFTVIFHPSYLTHGTAGAPDRYRGLITVGLYAPTGT